MRKFTVLILSVLIIVLSARNIYAVATPPSFAEIVDKSVPAVVNISTSQKIHNKKRGMDDGIDVHDILKFFEREYGLAPPPGIAPDINNRKITSLGSGFIIDSKGYIVTNSHVIEEADEIHVTLSGNEGGKSYKAEVIGKDPKTDIALLKINAGVELPFLNFGDSDKARVGDFVLVIGNPFTLGGTVTLGIISAKARDINSGHFDDFIQTDAAINVGNSGGPMLNVAGEVIGINSVILSPSKGNVGIGFAIPASLARPVIEQLRSKGEVTRGQLGVTLQSIDEDIAKGLDLNDTSGALVASVLKGSPAERVGIKTGDVITKFEGKRVTNPTQLSRMVGTSDINKNVILEVLRDGRYREITVRLERPKEDKRRGAVNDSKGGVIKSDLGVSVQDITEQLRRRFDISGDIDSGVVIVGVERSSVAALAGIRQGDVILSINKKPVRSAKDFDNIVSDIKKSGKTVITMLLSRGGYTSFISIESR